MRRYMLLIKANKDYEVGQFPGEQTPAASQFMDELEKAGAKVECARLRPSSQGQRVHFAGGKFTVTDGPFTETKELIAGFCLIEAESLEAAVAWAERMPFQTGTVEIRPLFELSDFPVDPVEQPDGWRDKEEAMRAAPPPARKPGTTRYIGMLKGDKATEAGVMPDERSLAAMGSFIEEGVKLGILLSGEGLQPSSKGARVQFSGNQRMVTDGPFAETKELVAGYAILQFASPAAALQWTKRFVQVDAPGRLNGECECEIRPIVD